MWLFNKKTLIESGLFHDFTDWHCHILPGVDDGVQSIEEALQLLVLYEELGVKEVWLTPHIMEDIPNTTSKLKAKFAELQTSYQGNIILHLAAEYMLDHLFKQRFQENDLLSLGENKNLLLVESSYFNPPMDLNGMLVKIKSGGYTPVLAHPERYIYMIENDYLQLKSMNIKFQLNLFSLVGSYGKTTKEKAEWLLKKGFYDLIGSDTHNSNIFSQNALGNKLKKEDYLKLLTLKEK